MRDSVQDEIAQAAEEFEETIQPLELRSDKSAQLAAHFKLTNSQIAILEKECLALTCAADDKKAFDLVHYARMDVKDIRVQVDKKRKELVADALDWQRTVNGEAKRLTALLAPIEDHLEKQEAIYTAEQDRIKAERQKAAQARIQSRIDALAAVGVKADLAEIALMPDEAFFRYLDLETKAFNEAEAIKAQEAAEKAQKEAEELERLAKLRAELDAEQKRLDAAKAEQDKQAAALKAEREAMDAEKNKQAQAAREEQIRKDAEAKAKADAEAKRIQAEKDKAAEDAKAQAIEAARPDAEKLLVLADAIENTAIPKMDSARACNSLMKVTGLMAKLVAYTREQAAELTK